MVYLALYNLEIEINWLESNICDISIFRFEDDTVCNVTVDEPPFQPNLEDFSFDSFIWTDPDTPNQLWICCTVYLCTEDVPGRNCSDDFVVSS